MLSNNNLARAAARVVAGLAALVALASCGGGTYQVSPFVPQRIISFGDEGSVLEGVQGLKYSINAVSTSTELIDCAASPLWNQILATTYNIVYENCNPEGLAAPAGRDLAVNGATVDDFVQQVASFEAGDQFNSNDLVTIWVGAHDILNEYQGNGGTGDIASMTLAVRTAGQTLAGTVNHIAGTGARVILLTAPDLGYSPYAYDDQLNTGNETRSILSQLTLAFNNSLRSNIINDGSKIGLVLVDDFTHNAVNSPNSYGLIANPNQSYGCLDSAPLPSCNDNTLNSDPSTASVSPTIWLWADPTHLAPTAHLQIGNQASARAKSNPF
jgi:outer membrane lipase/esterase